LRGTGKTLMSMGVAHTHENGGALYGNRDVPAAPGIEVGQGAHYGSVRAHLRDLRHAGWRRPNETAWHRRSTVEEGPESVAV
jgi:hypothetical protein